MKRGTKKGIVTLWSLLILSGSLLLFLMLDDEILASQRANVAERLRYLSQREQLLQQSIGIDADALCRRQGELQQQESRFFQVTFNLSSDNSSFQEGQLAQQHKINCHRLSLFKQLPQQAVQHGVTDFFAQDRSFWQQQQAFISLPLSQSDYIEQNILWLDNHTEWQVEQDFYGIVVANETLKLSGTGKIIGALVYQNQLQQAEENQIVFDSAIVRQLAEKYQNWFYRQDSWHDFNLL